MKRISVAELKRYAKKPGFDFLGDASDSLENAKRVFGDVEDAVAHNDYDLLGKSLGYKGLDKAYIYKKEISGHLLFLVYKPNKKLAEFYILESWAHK